MTRISSVNDPWTVIRKLEQRVRMLETAAPINHAAITRGTGLGVHIERGVHVEGGGSFSADQLEIDRSNGGSLRTPGDLEGGYVKSSGDVNADGTVRGYDGVMAPIDGQMQSLGPRVGQAQSAAEAAQSTANTANTRAGNAQSRADAAHSLASTAKSAADSAQGTADGIKNGTTPLQSPNMIAPKITGITSGSPGGQWAVLMVNTSTGVIRFVNQS